MSAEKLLVQRLLATGRVVLEETRSVVEGADVAGIRALATRLPTPGDTPWSIVATGAYNAGKSTLLSYLTKDDSIGIDSDVATDRVTSYPWGEVLLVDTPGVNAERPLHDELAEVALRGADLVLFVITVDLFEDATAAHFRHVALELGKLKQMLVIVNKAAKVAAEQGVRASAVSGALGREHTAPMIIECDGRSLLRSLAVDGDRRMTLQALGGADTLKSALDAFVREEGEAGRLRMPFEAVLAVAADAHELLVPEETELALGALLERKRRVLNESRERWDAKVEALLDSFIETCVWAGEKVITAAKNGNAEQEALDAYEAAIDSARSGLVKGLEQGLLEESHRLEVEEIALESGPEATRLSGALGKRSAAGLTTTGGRKSGLDLIVDSLELDPKKLVRIVVKQGNRAGSPMHTVVKTAGHAVGHKFKPWQIVRIAKRANFVLSAAAVVWDLYSAHKKAAAEDRQETDAINELRAQIRRAAAEDVAEIRPQIVEHAHDLYSAARQGADDLQQQVDALRENRGDLRSSLTAVESRCRTALRELDGTSRDLVR